MKKIYMLAACALMAGSISAKELSFQMGGVTLVPGKTVTFTDIEIDTTIDPEYPDITMDPHISLVSDIAASDVTLTAVCTSGQKIQVCAGGQCETGTTVTKRNVVLEAGVPLPTQFEFQDLMGSYNINDIPVVTTELSAMYGEDSSTQVKLIVMMGPEGKFESVTMIKADDALRVADGALLYNVEKASSISIFDMSGKRVISARVNGEGSLSTSGLAKGIYTYAISGGVTKTGKIFVK